MARQEADRKLGYFAISPDAIDSLSMHVRKPDRPSFVSILDPCAGEGKAVQQLANWLGLQERNIYCVEIEPGRANACRELMPLANVLTCSVFHANIQANSCSLAYVNPPYGNLPGGGMVEMAFLSQAVATLVPGGLMIAVLPERVVNERLFRVAMLAHFTEIKTVPLPSHVRKNYETFVFGVRRKMMINPEGQRWHDWQAHPHHVYELLHAPGPVNTFTKAQFDDTELWELLEHSPLEARIQAPPESLMERPPLALGSGHLALLLSGGRLDGLICPPNEPPHVVRGTCRKVPVITAEDEDVAKGDVITIKRTISERMDLIVRTVDARGVIRTHSSGGDDATDAERA